MNEEKEILENGKFIKGMNNFVNKKLAIDYNKYLDSSKLYSILPIFEWTTYASYIPEQISEDGELEIRRISLPQGTSLELSERCLGKKIAVLYNTTIFTILIQKFTSEEIEELYEKDEFIYNEDMLFEDNRNKGMYYFVWMSDTPKEYYEMLSIIDRVKPLIAYDKETNACQYSEKVRGNICDPCVPNCFTTRKQTILIGGLGLGLLANLLSLRSDIEQIVVIELNKSIIKMVSPYIASTKIKIINGDFFEIVEKLSKNVNYRRKFFPKDQIDTIIVDIWSNYEEKAILNNLYIKSIKTLEDFFPDSHKIFWDYEDSYDYYTVLKETKRI